MIRRRVGDESGVGVINGLQDVFVWNEFVDADELYEEEVFGFVDESLPDIGLGGIADDFEFDEGVYVVEGFGDTDSDEHSGAFSKRSGKDERAGLTPIL